jgi:predicted CXXCH cytochrome family protein
MSKPEKRSPPSVPAPKPAKSINLLLPALAILLLIVVGVWIYLQNSTPANFAPTPAVVSAPMATPAPAPAPVQAPVQASPANMVDEQQCQGCHSAQAKAWQGSHHQLAMQTVDDTTVLANFKDQTFKAEGESTRFFRKGPEFWINTPGDDGKPADFKVAYTFGVAPLQQYLIEVPGGRLQALGVAWDTEKNRWFHLYPGQGVTFKNPLHWSKPAQNANFMCVECHTTGYKRAFDPASNTFASHWNSLGVGCQSCHGPASKHLEWAAKPNDLLNAGFAVDLKNKDTTVEIETCARCHSRRAPLGDGYHAGKRLMDDYLPSALTRELYALDGKIKDEVFEHGSFLQSKMFDKGVRCSNCHNPHSTELKAAGNAVCLQCHNPSGKTTIAGVDGKGLQAKNYDSSEHHNHQMGQPGSQCVDCHMPGKFYMVNDFRHDHSFSIPNPERALKLGTPDACLGCHQNTASSKISEQFNLWYASKAAQPARYDESLQLIRNGLPGAATALFEQLQSNNLPAIRRATLLAELGSYPSQRALELAIKDLKNPAPQVRESAVHAVSTFLPPEQRAQPLSPLLNDPVLAVRIAAARDLLGVATSGLGAAHASWQAAIGEYEQVQLSLGERAEANLNLALLYQASGRSAEVEPRLRTALLRDPDFLPAVVTLVQWLEANGRHPEAVTLLGSELKDHADSALLHHTQGLSLIRAGQMKEAMLALHTATQLEPDNAQYGFVLAIATHDNGQLAQACEQLEAVLKRHPQYRDARLALVRYLQENAKAARAQQLLGELIKINPQDPVLVKPPTG